MAAAWTNWARNQACTPATVARPTTLWELTTTVAAAADRGQRVKAVGSGHSFTGIALTDGVQVHLDGMTGLARVDGDLVTLRAGTPLRAIPGLLAPHGLAMTNLGDVDVQTIAGAISTGTHGTGAAYGGIATQVEALTLVLAEGSVVRCVPGDDLFDAARVGLGALGVLAEVTLRCVPAFRLAAVERRVRFDEMLATFDELVAAHDHVEFYLWPHSDWTQLKQNDRTDAPPEPLGRVRAWVDDELLANTVFGALSRVGHALPATIPAFGHLSGAAIVERRWTDDAQGVFTSKRRVRFREMEYALPRAALLDGVREVRALIERRRWRISFPIEVRVAAADDIWLSTAHGRDTGYIAVHQYHRTPPEPYFAAVEEVMTDLGGRPHWGKLHTLDAERLAAVYPRFADFTALRDRLDPGRVFTNAHLDCVLGK